MKSSFEMKNRLLDFDRLLQPASASENAPEVASGPADDVDLKASSPSTPTVDAKMLKSHYLAFHLSEASQKAIQGAIPPMAGSRVICEHSTVQFKLDADSYKELAAQFKDAKLKVTGYACDESLECLTVSVNGEGLRPDGSRFHVTLSLGEGRKAKESNDLLAKPETIIRPYDIDLDAELKLLPK